MTKQAMKEARMSVALTLLMTAPVFRDNPAVQREVSRFGRSNIARLLSQSHWSTGEWLILKTAAAIAKVPTNGRLESVNVAELRSRLDDGNWTATADALATVTQFDSGTQRVPNAMPGSVPPHPSPPKPRSRSHSKRRVPAARAVNAD